MSVTQKQVCDIRAGKGMSIAQSNEHLRVGQENAYLKKISGTMDPTREHLNFEVGPGGSIKDVDKRNAISKRIKAILKERGITDPNDGLSENDPRRRRTVANIILGGSTEAMRKMAFGEQSVSFERGADNSDVTRCEEIENWAVDMYKFMAAKYGEKNIAAFIVHLDETNPHIHCTLLPVTPRNKISYNYYFGGSKDEGARKYRELHDQLSEVNRKYGLERGESIMKTGAQHKSYTEWLKDVIDGQETGEIKKAETRLKGLTTMIHNLEARRDAIAEEISKYEEMAKRGEITNDELYLKTLKLKNDLTEIEGKIADKKEKLYEAEEKMIELTKQRRQLQDKVDDLRRLYNKEFPNVQDKVVRDMSATAWTEAAREAQARFSMLEEFRQTLSPAQEKKFDDIFEDSIFEDMAERGNEIVAVSSAIFLGFLDQATRYAQASGGGGGGASKLKRRPDEDDESWRRRCFAGGRAMMKPAKRKIRRS